MVALEVREPLMLGARFLASKLFPSCAKSRTGMTNGGGCPMISPLGMWERTPDYAALSCSGAFLATLILFYSFFLVTSRNIHSFIQRI